MTDHQLLETAVRLVVPHADDAAGRLQSRLPSERILWRELVACILGSRVPSQLAVAATNYLFRTRLLTLPLMHPDIHHMESAIAAVLSLPAFPPQTKSGLGRRYRYPHLRARQIALTANNIYFSQSSLSAILHSARGAEEARERIASIAVGIGPKQASLFLTNIGFTNDLAILDSHVTTFMLAVGLLHSKPPLGSFRHYTLIESTLREYAKSLGTSLAALDLAIWSVMRAYNRGQWQ